MGLENIIEVYIKDIAGKNDEENHRYLVYALTELDIKQYPSDGVFLKEFDSLEKAQDYIVNDLSAEYTKGLSRRRE